MEISSDKKLEKYLDTIRLANTDDEKTSREKKIHLSTIRKFLDVKVLKSGQLRIVAKDDLPVY